jgi:hypothetical protein
VVRHAEIDDADDRVGRAKDLVILYAGYVDRRAEAAYPGRPVILHAAGMGDNALPLEDLLVHLFGRIEERELCKLPQVRQARSCLGGNDRAQAVRDDLRSVGIDPPAAKGRRHFAALVAANV